MLNSPAGWGPHRPDDHRIAGSEPRGTALVTPATRADPERVLSGGAEAGAVWSNRFVGRQDPRKA